MGVWLGLGWWAITSLQAQTDPRLGAEGRVLDDRAPDAVLRLFGPILADDSLHFEANWRSAMAWIDIGQATPDSIPNQTRDSAYRSAERFARRAIAADQTQPEGYFALAAALGRVALTRSKKDRVRYAVGIYEAATRALDIAPDHDGAHHVLGLWHAETMRTSGFNRFMAKKLLGGKLLGKANWAAAIGHLESAVRIDSTRIFHRLDLARIYVDRHRYSEARRELDRIGELPDREMFDARDRIEAARLLVRIADKSDRP